MDAWRSRPNSVPDNFDGECIKATGSVYGGAMYSFSRRQGYSGPVAEISIRHKASEALKAKVVSIGNQHGLASCEAFRCDGIWRVV